MRTILSAGWTVSSRLFGRGVDLITLVILARVLSPADFGITALAMSLIVIVETVLEIPLIQALTRLKVVERSHLDTAFTLGLLRSAVLAAFVIAAAWPLSRFYGDPKLVPLALFLSIGPAARGLVSPNMVRFWRDLRFQQIFIMEVVGKIGAALIALFVLHLGGGYWAIATNSVASPVLATIVSYGLAPYRPGFSLAKWTEFRDLIGWLSFAQMVSALNWQFDRLLLGRFIPRQTLGKYTMASDVAVLPTQSLIGPAMNPLMAALVHITADEYRLRAAYLRAARIVMLISVPACIGIALTADLIVATLLGSQWTGAAIYLQWIALTIVPHAYSQPFFSLALVLHKTRAIFELGLIDLLTRLVLMPPAIYFFLVEGVIAVRGVLAVIMFVITMLYVRRFLGVELGQQLLNLWKVALSSTLMTLLVLWLRHQLAELGVTDVVELGVVASSGAFFYFAFLYALGVRLRVPDVRFR